MTSESKYKKRELVTDEVEFRDSALASVWGGGRREGKVPKYGAGTLRPKWKILVIMRVHYGSVVLYLFVRD